MVKGIGTITAKKICDFVEDELDGDYSRVFTNADSLKEISIKSNIIENLKDTSVLTQAQKQIEYLNKYNINCHFWLEDDFPRKLFVWEDQPYLYYSKGENLKFDYQVNIGIVGTRSADSDAKSNINNLCSQIKELSLNPIIISGLAAGADTFAHKTALQYGLRTCAVIGHGFNTIYPVENRELAYKIIDNGGMILTEYYFEHPVRESNFVRRNRIVSALSDIMIVAQSKLKGGALVTADLSLNYDKDLYAFPGRAEDKLYQGCNQLIKTGKAKMITSLEDIYKPLGVKKSKEKTIDAVQTELFPVMDKKEKQIYDFLLKNGDVHIDELCHKFEIPMAQLSVLLFGMEMKKLVVSLPGKRYRYVCK